jgi:photosystem II stability/assembly factor-like uncharacterized protein
MTLAASPSMLAGPATSASASPAPEAASSPPQEPTTVQVVAVAFWDSRRGLVGNARYRSGATTGGAILATNDSGRSWATVATTPGPISQVLVSGSQDAWALSICEADGCSPQILHSSDGGATWRSQATSLTWLSFSDPQHGSGVSEGSSMSGGDGSAQFVRTVNGGATWTPVASPCIGRDVGPLRAVAFQSPANGMAVCALTAGAGGELHAVLATSNGGRSWTVRASTGGDAGSPVVGKLPYGGYVNGIVDAGDGTVWMAGERMVPLASSDGGRAWYPLGLGDEAVDLVHTAWPLDSRHGYAVMWDPDRQASFLELTADGGEHWQERFGWPVD